jgi:hypothetical protein
MNSARLLEPDSNRLGLVYNVGVTHVVNYKDLIAA